MKLSESQRAQKAVVVVKKFYPSGWYMLPINILSVMVSWHFNQSIFWAIVHWIFAIPNLIYRLLIGGFKDGGFMKIINSFI